MAPFSAIRGARDGFDLVPLIFSQPSAEFVLENSRVTQLRLILVCGALTYFFLLRLFAS